MDFAGPDMAIAKNALLTLLLYFGVVAMPQPPVDGQWLIAVPGHRGGILLELRSDGSKLTGCLSGPNAKLEIVNGSIAGDVVSFDTVMTDRRRSITVSYRGRIEGKEIHFTVSPTMPGDPRQIVATRRDPDAAPPDWFSEAPAPDEVVAWLKANAVALAPVEPDAASTDMGPLKAWLQGARVVAMGEATHGTREFQQLKCRMFRYLVEELGFTVFGIEANWPESLQINDYVLGAEGDPRHVLAGQFIWWQTEEVRDLILWMREYNRNPAHTRKLKFYGFDMQTPRLAESVVLDYLRRVDAESRETAARTFAVLGEFPENEAYETASAGIKRNTAEELAALLRRFDERKQEYIARSSEREWVMARQNMVIVRQAEVKLGNQNETGRAFRDRAMAENVKWILDQEPPETKMMLWAHNGHVAADGLTHPPMGAHLRRIFGEQALLCGFLFQQGSFQAFDTKTRALRAFTVGLPPSGSLDATFASIGIPFFAVDMRRIGTGKVADWFDTPHRSRQIGGGYSEAAPGIWYPVRAARAFDLLIYVDKTTPGRLL